MTFVREQQIHFFWSRFIREINLLLPRNSIFGDRKYSHTAFIYNFWVTPNIFGILMAKLFCQNSTTHYLDDCIITFYSTLYEFIPNIMNDTGSTSNSQFLGWLELYHTTTVKTNKNLAKQQTQLYLGRFIQKINELSTINFNLLNDTRKIIQSINFSRLVLCL